MNEFFAMGGYGFYVWGAYGVTALAIIAELIALRARRMNAVEAHTEASARGRELAHARRNRGERNRLCETARGHRGRCFARR